MAKKKRRRKHRRNASTKRRVRVHHRKRHTNPKRKRRVSHARKRHKNPRLSGRARRRFQKRRKHHYVRAHYSNPHKRHRRRHRRNPGLPQWAMGAFAALFGVVGYAVGTSGSYALTSKLDPTMNTLERNRYIVSGLTVLGGLFLSKKHPTYGLAIAAGGAAAAFGTQISVWLSTMFYKAGLQNSGKISAVYNQIGSYQRMGDYSQIGAYKQMGAYQPMGAVYGQTMGAVYGQTMAGVQDFVPSSPWSQPTPFGY